MTFLSFLTGTFQNIINGLASLRVSIDGYAFSVWGLILFLAIIGLIIELVEEA